MSAILKWRRDALTDMTCRAMHNPEVSAEGKKEAEKKLNQM